MKKEDFGFTLIELLIVVAIIAILAAIAIPNFLAAQTRAKVSRVKSETRSVATAMEAYYVDSNRYPPMGDYTWANTATEPAFHSRISAYLTTPVAYISSLPIDIFLVVPAGGFTYPYYNRYTYYNFFQYIDSMGLSLQTRRQHAGDWLIYSWGPDRSGNWYAPFIGEDGVYTNYDPSNGTVSTGNIIRTQRNQEKYDTLN
ncbi:MAG: type II secretion system protein [bacterium]